MIRVLNFFCVAAMGLTILALYHVSEQTRFARVHLGQVEQRIADDARARWACCRPSGSRWRGPNASRSWPNPRWT